MNLCFYGCGNPSLHLITKKLIPCCSKNYQNCPFIKEKNSNGLKISYINGRKSFFKTATKEELSRDWSKGKHFWNDSRIKSKFTLEQLFSYTDESRNDIRKNFIIDKRGYLCENCGIKDWNNKPLTLELDHIDGDNKNNFEINLKLLCPNCHSQTITWKRGKGSNYGKEKVSDTTFIEALHSTSNIRQALIKVGLTAKGANYIRAKKLLAASINLSEQ